MAGFGGAVKLTGESEYKAALKSITQNLKEVSSEMKVVTSLYGKNDTSIAAMTAKQDVLNKKLTEQKNKLSTLKAEYKAMETQYNDNTRKHEELVESYNEESAKLKQLEATVGVTSDEYKAQEKVVAELEKELMKSSAAQKANEQTMSQMRIAINNAEADVNKTTKSLDELETALNDAADEGDDLGDAMDDAGSSAESASGGFTVMKGVLADLASTAIRACVDAMKDFLKQTIETGKNFDSAMSEVQAISGATDQDLAMLRDTAKDFGSTTMFSASEAADALKYMSLAGWDANTSASALGGVLDLAAASGMDLASASDMVTDYLSAFGLEAKDSGKFADQLAYAQSNANTTAEGLGEAFKNCAANMNAAGQDVETTTSLLSDALTNGERGKGCDVSALAYGAAHFFIKGEDQPHQGIHLFQLCKGIPLVKGVLLQEVLTQRLRGLQRHALLGAKSVHTHQLYDLLQLTFHLQDAHDLLCFPAPIGGDVLFKPRGQTVVVERIGIQPVDRREVATVGKRGIQAPEHLDDTQRCLSHGLGDITALRRNGTDGGQRPLAAVTADADDLARALVELRKTRGQIGRVALLTGHFLKAARHFAQRLCPTGGGIRDNGYGIAHIAIIFSDRDARVDRCLTRRYGHI